MDHRGRLIRAYRFRASHHYRVAGWSEAENRRVFGDQADSHAHHWRVEVHVAGPVDPRTGWCADLGLLDGAWADLTAGWDDGDLNALVPEVAAAEMTPSTENLARWLHGRLAAALSAPRAGGAPAGPGHAGVEVVEVRVFESDDLGSAWPA